MGLFSNLFSFSRFIYSFLRKEEGDPHGLLGFRVAPVLWGGVRGAEN